ncbi:C-X-C chemokine receptor type 4-like [Hydractinia symbiolongicarpus]|uniref:C-X-C chemokine receptor type 4-like n=1 Tax=Hydractinia symbiolongicarpus TaxID=13093 RepID=UPI00254B2BFB|nr:C-X-C chemokine receptor type 4-like [Hydractinia symbiolongicarpus]
MLVQDTLNITDSNIICEYEPIQEEAKVNIEASYITSLILSLIIIVINAFFLLSYLAHRSLRHRINFLYIILSMSDFLFGLFSVSVICIILNKSFNEQCGMRDILITGGFAFCNIALASITAISVEIYLAIVKPFSHATRREKNTVAKVLVGMWIPCIALPIISRYHKSQLWGIYFISIGVLIIILQCFIILVQTAIYISVNRARNARSKDKYAAVTSAIFICTYFISFLPLSVVGIYSKLSSHGLFMESYVIPWVYLLATINCVADPIVSIMRTPKWRETIFKHVTETSTSA